MFFLFFLLFDWKRQKKWEKVRNDEKMPKNSARDQHVKHPFAGQKTQHPSLLFDILCFSFSLYYSGFILLFLFLFKPQLTTYIQFVFFHSGAIKYISLNNFSIQFSLLPWAYQTWANNSTRYCYSKITRKTANVRGRIPCRIVVRYSSIRVNT